MYSRLLFLIIISFFTFQLYAIPTNYFISPTGNNTNNGLTSTAPKATLANVFSTYNLGAGDTIFVAAGTYSEKGIVIGPDDEGFVIHGAALDASGVPTSIFICTTTLKARWLLLGDVNNDDISINNLKIKDYISTGGGIPEGGGGIKIIPGATNLKVTSCYFDNCDTQGAGSGHSGGAIYASEYFTITKSTIVNCDANKFGGAIILEGSPTNLCIVSKCVFNNNNSGDYGSSIFSDITKDPTKVLKVINSLFYANGKSSGSGCIVSKTGRVLIINSTITSCSSTLINNASHIFFKLFRLFLCNNY
jgi:hypothetical protein